jgi:crossover junction endodeoxyribonuclease RuvC
MKILGLDIATETGWSYIEDDKLIDYGLIRVDNRMDLPQRLHYFHLALTRLFEKYRPDHCFIEDVILGISGAKTLAYLGRLNGVAINAAFGVLQDRIKLYTPTYWKANSFDGLGGMAKKWQIQLACIKHFNINIVGNFDSIDSMVHDYECTDNNTKICITDNRTKINKLKASLNRKRNPLTDDDKKQVTSDIKKLEIHVKTLKSQKKDREKKFNKNMERIALDISAQTGMTPDICDACGIAICGIKEMVKNNVATQG